MIQTKLPLKAMATALAGGLALGALLPRFFNSDLSSSASAMAPGLAPAVGSIDLTPSSTFKPGSPIPHPLDPQAHLGEIEASLRAIDNDPDPDIDRRTARYYAELVKLSEIELQTLATHQTMHGSQQWTGWLNWVLFARWFAIAPETAAAYFKSEAAQGRLNSGALSAWADRQPTEALAWIATQPREKRGDLLSEILPTLNKTNASATLAALQAMGKEGENLYGQFFSSWADTDLPGALSAWKKLPEGKIRDASLRKLLEAGAKIDPEAMLKLGLETSQKKDQPNYDYEFILEPLVTDNPFFIIDFSRNSPTDYHRSALKELGIWGLAQTDPNAAWDYVVTQTSGGEQRSLIRSFLANNFLGTTEAQFMNALPAGPNKEAAITGYLSDLSRADPEEAAAYLAKLPAGAEQVGRTGTVISSWARADPTAAGNWLRTQPSGPARDAGSRSFASALAMRQPTAALDWAYSISDEKLQRSTLARTYNAAAAADNVAASAWLEKANLPPDFKKWLQP